MLFHTEAFFLLFAVACVAYWLLRCQTQRLAVLLVASLVFYIAWNPWLLLLLGFSVITGFALGHRIEQASAAAPRRRWLVAGIGLHLALLGFFKYTNFLIGVGWSLVGSAAAGPSPMLDIVLPLGISFYTFESICYLVEVHAGRSSAEKSLLNYSVFLTFFPHLVAGPIVRPAEFLPQIREKLRWDPDQVYLGLRVFLRGLIKKAVIADQLAQVADPVFSDPSLYGSSAIWFGVICYAIQIYCDFSGYTDMAVGCAHGFGLRLPDNFRMPYFSVNIVEFWQRWHITLSRWLRDYLYIPLGGSRRGSLLTHRNLLLTMFLGGLWHGAAWTFAVWGIYHGALLVLHRLLPCPAWLGHRSLAPLKVLFTFLCVCIGWVFFRAQNFPDAALILDRMFVPTGGLSLTPSVQWTVSAIFAVVFIAHLLGTFVNLDRWQSRIPAPVAAACCAAAFLVAQLLMPDAGPAFIYFQF